MQVLSTNIAQPRLVKWRGRHVKTGIYKTPTSDPLILQKEEVQGDEVSDRKHHGGLRKACYMFSEEQYGFWKIKYPDLDWHFGMFGENLTIIDLNEREVYVGATYSIGDAIVKVTQPREPCYKLGIRFGTQKILRQFIVHGYPGAYLSVEKEGSVVKGDTLTLIERPTIALSIYEYFELLYAKHKNLDLLRRVVNSDLLTQSKNRKLTEYLN